MRKNLYLLILAAVFVVTGCNGPEIPEPVEYKVVLQTQEGVTGGTVELNSDGTIKEPAEPVREGYSFAGWYKDKEFTQVWNFSTDKVNSDTTLYAKWLAGYAIQYELNGGANAPANPLSYTVESAAITLADPTRLGYIFEGWFCDNTFATAFISIPSGSTGNKIIYAKWSDAITYSIDYELNEGSFKSGESIPGIFTVNDMIEIPTPSRLNRSFEGWYDNAEFSGSPVTTINTGSTGNRIFYAKWTWAEYKVGNVGPTGGKIFWINETPGDPHDSEAWKYMEAAPADLEPTVIWSNIISAAVGNTFGEVGTGLSNSNTIIKQSGHNSSAAKACLDFSIEVNEVIYDDWFLPSIRELNRMENASCLSGRTYYWSSTEHSATQASRYGTAGVSSGYGESYFDKNTSYSIRPLRRF